MSRHSRVLGRHCVSLQSPSLAMFPLSVAMAIAAAAPVRAETQQDKMSALAATIEAQQAKLNHEELQLEEQSLELSRQQQLLDTEMSSLRGAGQVAKAKTKGSPGT